ncbi:MAG: DUF1343 domain-containing protein [Candidatus Eisenbacteria bacterium]
MVRTGLDIVLERGLRLPGKGRAGLLCNHATVDPSLRGAPELLAQTRGIILDRLFSPQHGFAAEKQDNMVESGHDVHGPTGLPIWSLYGDVREPLPEMLEGLDAILIDVPDVGTRVYTFLVTALYLLREAGRRGIPVWILDRPNPIGGNLCDGPLLAPAFTSFVGYAPVPLQHGLTAGEYCRFGMRALRLPAELHVVAVEGWRRDRLFDATGLPWVMPSPNMPTLETALVFPGGVMLEGTNLSEGRGTTRPFELFGAPWVNPGRVRRRVATWAEHEPALRGFHLRIAGFEPTFHKFRGQMVRGFQLHVTDRSAFRPVLAYLAVFCALRAEHPEFAWREPPYEYETERSPIDLILGTDRVRIALDDGATPSDLLALWRDDLARFEADRRADLLYD